jgi:formylglycine-generating enzyme required for sulfatase activity
VDSFPEGATPDGIHHLLGNVSEWTDTRPSVLVDGARRALPFERIHLGQSWLASMRGQDLATAFAWTGTEPSFASFLIGFRCVAEPRHLETP